MTAETSIEDFGDMLPGEQPAIVYVTLDEYMRDYHGALSEWQNPLPIEQRVDVNLGERKVGERRNWRGVLVPIVKSHVLRIVFPPKSTLKIPSLWDRVIVLIGCSDERCRDRRFGLGCSRGHEGIVLGGIAPFLRRPGIKWHLPESFVKSMGEAIARAERNASTVDPDDVLARLDAYAASSKQTADSFASRAKAGRK